MNETKKNIQEYQNKKPRVRAKLMSAALMLIVALALITTSTFAWFTISANPEVSDISTTLAANGNLEIALANGTKDAPGATMLGDGGLTDIPLRNTTWGNLINLADPSYGFNNMVLRPAFLSKSSLIDSPLYGAKYDADGRRVGWKNDFAYASWNNETGEFDFANGYGVRAITALKMKPGASLEARLKALLDTAKSAPNDIKIAYEDNMLAKQVNKDVLVYFVGIAVDEQLNGTNPTLDPAEVQALRDLFASFLAAFDEEREAWVALANLQIYINSGGASQATYTADTLVEAYQKNPQALKNELAFGEELQSFYTELDQHIKDRATIEDCYKKLAALVDAGGNVTWTGSGIKDMVNKLVDMNSCTVGGYTLTELKALAKNNITSLMGLLNGTDAVIGNGLIKRFEQRTGASMASHMTNVKIPVKYVISLSITADVMTNAAAPYAVKDATEKLTSQDINLAQNYLPEDTYGFAVDFWVRTNAASSYLTIEGNVIVEKKEVDVKGKDLDGNEVQIYVATIEIDGEEFQIDVYNSSKDDANPVWFDASGHEEVTGIKGTPVKKIEIVEEVVGYEGENRVWGNNAALSTDSTTQGSGSCYVFYADTPEDKQRSLELMRSMKIAFVDIDGNYITGANMDVDHVFDDDGKIIVPIVLEEGSVKYGTDIEGNDLFGIMPLEKNRATLITAIVYLDGSMLGNEDVLSASDIQGTMNIQFGSSQALVPMSNEELAESVIKVSASIPENQISFDMDNSPAGTTFKSDITVKVEGANPSVIKAFFVRKINDKQGIPMNGKDEIITFTNNGGGNWTASYIFDTPGKYVLRSLQIDGIEYDLDDRPEVTVAGFAMKNAVWETEGTVYTSASSVTTPISVEFVTEDPMKMPKTVDARFINQETGEAVNSSLKRNPTTNKWEGEATFISSGEYAFEWLVLNGDSYTETGDFKKSSSIYLGMYTEVYTTSPTEFLFLPDKLADNEKNLELLVRIKDNTGAELEYLQGARLQYVTAGAGIKGEITGLSADIKWDAARGYYVGVFESAVGAYEFGYVSVFGNVISHATTAPSFTIINPKAPSFNMGMTPIEQYVPEDNAPGYINIKLNDAEAIPDSDDENNPKGVWGFVTNSKDGEEMWVKGTLANHTYNFPIVKEGKWTMSQIKISGVYSESLVEYTFDNPLIIEIPAGTAGVSANIYHAVKVNLEHGEDITFSGNSFLEAYTLTASDPKALLLNITSSLNEPFPDVKSVVMKYNYEQKTADNGGYTTEAVLEDNKEITFVKTADGKYIQSGDLIFKYAGEYVLSEITIDYADIGKIVLDTPADLVNAGIGVHRIIVKTNKPTVAITSIAPEGSHTTFVKTGSNSGEDVGVTSSIVGNTVTIYCDSQKNNRNVQINQYPEVTLSVQNLGAAQSATADFSGGASSILMYTSSNRSGQTKLYSWTPDSLSCTRYIGEYTEGGCSSAKNNPAGNLSADTLVLVDANNVEYHVAIDIKINNLVPSA